MSHLWWVSVPGGRDAEDSGLLRLVILPVLDGSLDAAGLTRWPPPSLLEGVDLQVDVATEVPHDQSEVTTTVSVRPHLSVVAGAWEEFFGAIEVTGPRAVVERQVDVAPTADQATELVGAYQRAARAITSEDAGDEWADTVRAEASRIAARDLTGARSARAERNESTTRPDIDFNLGFSLLREHPAVLRALGLILDLTIPRRDLDTFPERGVLSVRWDDPPKDLPAIRPRWTSYQRSGFQPAPRPDSPLHPGGFVALADDRWRVLTLDPELSLGALVDAAGQVVLRGLPAMRTAGLLLVDTSRRGDLEQRAGRSRSARDPARDFDLERTPLEADDLVLGYRIDARVFGGTWRSLTRRHAIYDVNDLELVTDPDEEGHVKVGGGVDEGDGVLRASQVVARWDGWSLAAPRPPLGTARQAPARSRTAPYHLGADLTPHSLPRLAFAVTYQLRARVADIAGGGPPLLAPSPDGCDTDTVPFMRLEPVLPPDVRLPVGAPEQFGTGASLYTLVVRAPEGAGTAPVPGDSAGPDPDTGRDLVAPGTSFEVVERHGKFAGDPAASLALVARSDLPDPGSGGVTAFVRGVAGEPPRDLESRTWAPLNRDDSAGEDLPDPWPNLDPKRMVLLPRLDVDEPTLDFVAHDLLVVRLSPAEEATVEISSLIDQRHQAAFAISTWLGADAEQFDDGQTADKVAEAEALLRSGRHPMATPARRIRVRHAVRRPMGTPAGDLLGVRPAGATYVDLSPPLETSGSLIGVHPASTIAVDVTAGWQSTEDLDDPAVSERPVGRIDVNRSDTRLAGIRHEIGDTKHREVTYRLTTVSRFRDCYDDADTAPPEAFSTTGTIGPISILSSARPPAPAVRSVVPGFVWDESRQPDGTVIRRRLGNRVRVELGAPWHATGDGERLVVLVRGADPIEVADHVTQCGRDPIWQTDEAPRFPMPRGEPTRIVLADGSGADAVLHTAWSAGDAWFADVAFPALPSYGALIQLALARHQPFSLRQPLDLSTSEVTMTDFVPLLPDRTLTITPGAGEVHATLEGLGPTGPLQNRVDVVVEQQTSGVVDGASATVGDGGVWAVTTSVPGSLDQQVTVPVPSGAPTRLRIREVECIGIVNSPRLGTLDELSERVVFTDSVLLPFAVPLADPPSGGR